MAVREQLRPAKESSDAASTSAGEAGGSAAASSTEEIAAALGELSAGGARDAGSGDDARARRGVGEDRREVEAEFLEGGGGARGASGEGTNAEGGEGVRSPAETVVALGEVTPSKGGGRRRTVVDSTRPWAPSSSSSRPHSDSGRPWTPRRSGTRPIGRRPRARRRSRRTASSTPPPIVITSGTSAAMHASYTTWFRRAPRAVIPSRPKLSCGSARPTRLEKHQQRGARLEQKRHPLVQTLAGTSRRPRRPGDRRRASSARRPPRVILGPRAPKTSRRSSVLEDLSTCRCPDARRGRLSGSASPSGAESFGERLHRAPSAAHASMKTQNLGRRRTRGACLPATDARRIAVRVVTKRRVNRPASRRRFRRCSPWERVTCSRGAWVPIARVSAGVKAQSRTRWTYPGSCTARTWSIVAVGWADLHPFPEGSRPPRAPVASPGTSPSGTGARREDPTPSPRGTSEAEARGSERARCGGERAPGGRGRDERAANTTAAERRRAHHPQRRARGRGKSATRRSTRWRAPRRASSRPPRAKEPRR